MWAAQVQKHRMPAGTHARPGQSAPRTHPQQEPRGPPAQQARQGPQGRQARQAQPERQALPDPRARSAQCQGSNPVPGWELRVHSKNAFPRSGLRQQALRCRRSPRPRAQAGLGVLVSGQSRQRAYNAHPASEARIAAVNPSKCVIVMVRAGSSPHPIARTPTRPRARRPPRPRVPPRTPTLPGALPRAVGDARLWRPHTPGTCRSSTPEYADRGRMRALEAACSMMCAVHPVMRAAMNRGVKISVSNPSRW